MYVGLGAAYFVNATGDFSGAGQPRREGLGMDGATGDCRVRPGDHPHLPGRTHRLLRGPSRYHPMSPNPPLSWAALAALPLPLAMSLAGLSCLRRIRGQDFDHSRRHRPHRRTEKALTELAEARRQVETERLPLAREIAGLEQRVIERRAELAKAQQFQENQLVELNALKAEARRRADEVKFIDALLTEYGRAFQSRLHFGSEEPRYAGLFAEVEKAAAPDLTAGQRFDRRAAPMAAALKRVGAFRLKVG